jgi:hypothetical protein
MQLSDIEIQNFKSESSVKTRFWNVRTGLLLTVGLLLIAATVLGYMTSEVNIPIGLVVAVPWFIMVLDRSQAMSINYKLLARYISEDAEALAVLSK